MEIIQAPEVQPMPYGLLSVASTADENRAAHNGFVYQQGCGTGVGFTGGPCEGSSVTFEDLVATVTFGSALPYEASVDWGDESEPEAVAAGETSVGHTYASTGEYTITVSGVGGTFTYTVDLATPLDGTLTAAEKAETGQITTVDSTNFNLYALTRCNAVGRDPSINGAVDRMNSAESHVLEQVLSTFAEDISGSATDHKEALAELQALWFGMTHGVRPIIHINAALLHYLPNVERHGSHLELRNGALVSAGSGYPLDQVLISGMPTIRRGQMLTHDVHEPVSNTVTDFAERTYALSVGCEGLSSITVPLPWE